ncbi:MBL fold metallo-hydrolase [Agromyces sp. ISL-38]|uniref:MBL fold metallo-hydrolase n=1 Tax=Agromyces sp. ISL-38 TaxID=2819107 RepID=UPI001BEBC126|nr:MBL fold metallo-hydrolase [Agromyces sp. ISL-38]MBT2499097.1 MBL fold metallo-hydrolase [Agromyces sp. ISL-38]MBT2518360.1 MBL fold metallo-hydrolase [Streptomyces sp. ISL-90]
MDETSSVPSAGERVSPVATLLRAPNPGPMTLDGTNSFVLRAPGAASCVVVDPGPDDAGHLARLAAAGPVELILVTHHHADHTEGVARFASMTDAPVRAIDPALCLGAPPLSDRERIKAAGLEIEVVATPGHTTDSVCFVLPGDEALGVKDAVVTGDTILGRGTTIISDPDGALGPYLASLERLRALGSEAHVLVLPGHGPALPDLATICDAYLAHRAERIEQIRAALAELGADASVVAVTDLVYADTDASVRSAAEASVRAQLRYLRGTA